MFGKFLSLVLVVLLINAAALQPATVHAASKEAKGDRFAERVREDVSRLGTGEAARVEVRLWDKTRVRGHIREAGADSFSVVDERGAIHTVFYPQVRKVKGNNLSTGARIAIGVAVVGAILTIAVLAGRS